MTFQKRLFNFKSLFTYNLYIKKVFCIVEKLQKKRDSNVCYNYCAFVSNITQLRAW